MAEENTIVFKSEQISTFTERGFQPIVETFCSMLNDNIGAPIDTLEEKSVQQLRDGIEFPFMKGVFKVYAMDKCEKITLSNCIMMDRILACAVTAIPADDYELPIPVLEWSETENVISVLVDFIPAVDLAMRQDYREKYLDPLEQYWTKYKDFPGMEPNRFAWTRQLLSPYYLCAHISKEDEENKKLCVDIFKDYLGVWLGLWQNAEPVKDEQSKKYSISRKAQIRKIFRDNDEGAKSMRQMIGEETVDAILLCNF